MAQARANGIDVEYEVFGPVDGEAVLLVMGLGAQLLAWPVEFCERLAADGLRVIRFDNRDVGLSTKFDDVPVDLSALVSAVVHRGPVADPPYLLLDMANDAFGLLDALEIDSAHVVGVSMGGMIAQTMAITRPERVRTLTSIMSTTGNPDVGKATPDALTVLFTPPPPDREEYIEYGVKLRQVLSGPGFPFDQEEAAHESADAFDRSFYPIGIARQLVAIVASGDRTEDLRNLTVPTLVIHGDGDPLVNVSGGEATATAVPGAQLRVIEGMGHTMPSAVQPPVADAITDHIRAAAAG